MTSRMYKMSKHTTSTLALLWILLGSVPARAEVRAVSMDSCMRYAIVHASDIQRQRIATRQSEQEYRRAVTGFLPSLGASMSAQYQWGRSVDPETNTYNNVTTFNNYWQLYASLTLFDGFATVNAFRQARLVRQSSQTTMQRVSDDIAADVMQKYIEAAYAQACIGIARDCLDESRRQLHLIETLYELGEKGRPDVVQMESQVAGDEYALIHQQNVAAQALLDLKSAMNFPQQDSLRIALQADAEDFSLSAPTGAEQVFAIFQQISPQLREAEQNAEYARLGVRIRRGYLMPSISLSAGIYTSYYRNLSYPGSATPFGSQFRNNRGEYFGVSLSLPFLSPSNWHALRQATMQWHVSLVNLEERRRRVHDDVAKAVMDMQGCERELTQMCRKTRSDSLSYHATSRKYEEGMVSTFDLQTSARTLLESRIKTVQMQMLLVMKRRLVDYYQGRPLVRD
ncbi:MAG: TolC family protein [Bacteroidaceae bacterium]